MTCDWLSDIGPIGRIDPMTITKAASNESPATSRITPQGVLLRGHPRPVHGQHALARDHSHPAERPGSACQPTSRSAARTGWPAGASSTSPTRSTCANWSAATPNWPGKARRLMLTGSRGFAVAYLWHSAIEAQKRNDFHKMEKRIGAVTSASSRTSSRPGSSRAGTSRTTCRSRCTARATCTTTSPAASSFWPRASAAIATP